MKVFKNASFLIIAGLVMIISGCKKESKSVVANLCDNPESVTYQKEGNCLIPENVQKSMFIKFTGTWCWACGDYGADIVHQMEAKYHHNLVIFEAHKNTGESMNNSIVDDWENYWAHTNTPSFVANSKLLSGHPIAPASAEIGTTNATAPTVGLAAAYSISDKLISGTAYLKAFSSLSGNYNLAVYVVGDGFVDKQIADDGSKNPASYEFDPVTRTYLKYVHTNILRGEVSNLAFGKKLLSGTTAKNKVAELAFSLPKDAEWTEKLRIVVVAWIDKGNGTYTFVNAANGTLK